MASQIVANDLDEFPQPEWNDRDSVSRALQRTAAADSEETSVAAYHDLLYAVGNNHAGTYYPVVLAVVPAFERFLHDGSPWAQRTVLEALTDLCGSFEPESGYEEFRGTSLESALRQSVLPLMSIIETLARGAGATADSAVEFLEYFQLTPRSRSG